MNVSITSSRRIRSLLLSAATIALTATGAVQIASAELPKPLEIDSELGQGDSYNSRTARFTKTQTCYSMEKGYLYIYEVYSYKFRPKLTLRNLADAVLATGDSSEYDDPKHTDQRGNPLRVYKAELRYRTNHSGPYYFDISSHDISNGPFRLVRYKLDPDNPYGEQ